MTRRVIADLWPSGAEFIDLRAKLGLSQAAFAALLNDNIPGLGADASQMSLWECEHKRPHPALLVVARQIVEAAK